MNRFSSHKFQASIERCQPKDDISHFNRRYLRCSRRAEDRRAQRDLDRREIAFRWFSAINSSLIDIPEQQTLSLLREDDHSHLLFSNANRWENKRQMLLDVKQSHEQMWIGILHDSPILIGDDMVTAILETVTCVSDWEVFSDRAPAAKPLRSYGQRLFIQSVFNRCRMVQVA